MALSQTGVRLVAENEQGYLSALSRAEKATNAFANASTNTAKQASILGDVFKGALLANIVTGAISQVTSEIANLGAQALNSAEQMQTLRISLETLAAREIMTAGGADNMTDALGLAGPMADYLMGRLRELSLVSPFEYKDILRVFRLNMAFGQTSDMALKLTKAITDVTAASGQGGYMMERIAYNFSQMSLTGKVTMRDVRDLALAGFDLSRMLREQLGMSIEEVNAALESGKITMQDVSQAFVDYAEKNFGGAAERMSKTFAGLKSSFSDLLTFTSIDVLGPALERVTAALNNLFTTARMFVDSGALKDIGVIFDNVVSLFVEKAPEMPAATDQALIDMRTQFQDAAVQAVEWGANIVTSLAEGMIMGLGAVLSALNWIANAIASWLMPGSPPKILPDIDQWGTATMTEYLKGFTEADFSALSGIQNPMKQIFKMLKVDDSSYQGISQKLAQALAAGTTGSEDLFAQIRASAGEFGDELVDLTQKQLALAAASDKVKAAEAALKAARTAEAAAFGVVDAEMAKYNKMLKEGAPEDQLAAQRKLIKAKYQDAKAAAKNTKAKSAEVDQAKESMDTLKEQVKLQSQLLDQLIQFQREQEAAKKAKAGGGTGGGAGEIVLPKVNMPAFGGMSGLESNLADLGEKFKERIAAIFTQMKTDLQTQWDNSGIKTSWDGLTKTFGDFFAMLPPGTLEGVAKVAGIFLAIAGAAGILGLAVGAITSPIGLALLAITGFVLLFKFKGEEMAAGAAAWNGVPQLLGQIFTNLWERLISGLTAFGGGFKVLWEGIKTGVTAFIDGFKLLWDALKTWFDEKLQGIKDGLSAFGDGLKLLLDAIGEKIGTWISDTITAVGKFVGDFTTAGVNLIQGLIDGIASKAQEVVDMLVGLAQQALNKFWELLGQHSPSKVMFKSGQDIMEGLTLGVDNKSRGFLGSVSNVASAVPGRVEQVAQTMPAQYINTSSQTINMNMGGQTVNNGMDVAMIYSIARQAVVNALAGS